MLGSLPPSLSFLPFLSVFPLSTIAVAPLLSAKASLARGEKETGEPGKGEERREEGKIERARLTDYITAAVGAWKRPSSGP